MKELLRQSGACVVVMLAPALSYFFPDAFAPDYMVLTYGRGWIHCSKLKPNEAIHGMSMPYVSLD